MVYFTFLCGNNTDTDLLVVVFRCSLHYYHLRSPQTCAISLLAQMNCTPQCAEPTSQKYSLYGTGSPRELRLQVNNFFLLKESI